MALHETSQGNRSTPDIVAANCGSNDCISACRFGCWREVQQDDTLSPAETGGGGQIGAAEVNETIGTMERQLGDEAAFLLAHV